MGGRVSQNVRGWARFWARLGAVPLALAHWLAWAGFTVWTRPGVADDLRGLLGHAAGFTQLILAVGLYYALIQSLLQRRLHGEGAEWTAILSGAAIEIGLSCAGWMAYAEVWITPARGFDWRAWSAALTVYALGGMVFGGPMGLLSWFVADIASTHIERDP